MTRNSPNRFGRRTVLKVTAAGIVTGSVSPGTAVAEEEKGAYGNGNGLDDFLNEEAALKENPIWDGEIADRRGEEVVNVAVGAMTSVKIPDPEAPPVAPFAFDPMVVKVSPGAKVRWTWVSNPFDFPIPHDVTSLVDEDGDPVLEEHGDAAYHHHDQYTPATEENELEEDLNPTFVQEFSDHGNHLYYCTPHGAPFEYHDFYNAFGMRGAVKVSGKKL